MFIQKEKSKSVKSRQARSQDWHDRRVTRSQAAKLASSNKNPSNEESQPPVQNKESPTETFRHGSFSSSNCLSPDFYPPLDTTTRELHKVSLNETFRTAFFKNENDVDLPDIDDNFVGPGVCNFMCCFRQDPPFNVVPTYDCSKCDNLSVCALCLEHGGHQHHRKFLQYVGLH